MIILDTHVFVWWIHKSSQLQEKHIRCIEKNEATGLGVSAISCWEIAKLIEKKRLVLPLRIEEWFETAFVYPGIELIPLTPQIAVESTQLPGEFHKDPADQIIVATTRILNCTILTFDERILNYPHVEKSEV